MRILVFLNSLYTGGAEFSTLSFYGWLLNKGYSVKVVCLKKTKPSYDPIEFGFKEVHYISGVNDLARLQSFNRIIREFNPRIIHSVLFQANLMTRCARMLHPNFIHVESLVNEMYSPFRLADPNITKLKLEAYRWLDKLTQYWGVDHFHANGVSVAQHYRQKLDIASKRITIIPRGRRANAYLGDSINREKIRTELQTRDRLMMIIVARHEYQKGQDVLLDAVYALGELKEQIQIVLVGREGNFTSVIRNRIKSFRLEKCVTVLGHRSDVAALLAAADVFVFPSRFEGLPGALIEAEAAGLPIICSDIPNNREVVQDGINAFLFPLNDSIKLAQGMRKLMTERELLREMGKQSLVIFQDNFSIDEVHQKMKIWIDSIMQSPRENPASNSKNPAMRY